MTANLLDFDLEGLAAFCDGLGEKRFRAVQLYRWIHQKGESDFARMSDLAKSLRGKLAGVAEVKGLPLISEHRSADGTTKWLFDVGAGNAVETVFIPEVDRGTLCVSSQAGCAVGCRFCSTGHQGFSRNLTTGEIVAQLWFAEHRLRDTLKLADGQRAIDNVVMMGMGEPLQNYAALVPALRTMLDDHAYGLSRRRVTVSTSGVVPMIDRLRKTLGLAEGERAIDNVVMMGMGEPLQNYAALVPALRTMLDDHAYGLSRRRVTVSTSGVVPMIDRLREDCPVALAVSLHAPNDALRDSLVPLNRKHPIATLLAACTRYLSAAPRDFITFEYCMLDGVNDTPEHARELVRLVKGRVPCKFNLIPFNPFPASGLTRSPRERVTAFADVLLAAGIVTTIRRTRGDDIDAACGQLAGEVQDRTNARERLQRQRQTIPIAVAGDLS